MREMLCEDARGAEMGGARTLLEHAVDLVLILEIERLWCAVGVDALAIQEEPERVLVHALALRVRVEDLLHARRLLDFEEGLRAHMGGETGRDPSFQNFEGSGGCARCAAPARAEAGGVGVARGRLAPARAHLLARLVTDADRDGLAVAAGRLRVFRVSHSF